MVTNTTDRSYNPGTLEPNTVYYWKVDEVESDSTIKGSVWQFRIRVTNLPPKVGNPNPGDQEIDVEAPVKRLLWTGDSLQTDSYKTYFGTHPDSVELISAYSVPGYYLPPLVIGETYYWRVDAVNQEGTTTGDLWQFSMKKSYYSKPDYYQSPDEQGIISMEAEDFTDSTNIGDHYWQFVTDTSGYSGSGAMQALPDKGAIMSYRYFERCSRLDYAVDFIKTGTHYIWIRAYAPSESSNSFNMGINFLEEKNAAKIGNFKGTGQWEWINAHPNSGLKPTPIRSFEVEAIGTQGVSLWCYKDGVVADKIVLTTDPNYVPTGLGPDVTVGIEDASKVSFPDGFRLYQNFPNPFNPETTIKYDIPEAAIVELKIYDTLGRVVRVLENGYKNNGSYQINWDSKDNTGLPVAGGVYFARLKSKYQSKSIKLLYLK